MAHYYKLYVVIVEHNDDDDEELNFNGLFTPPTWTRQNCLVLSAVVFTPPTPQDKTVLSRPRRQCEQAINELAIKAIRSLYCATWRTK